MTERRCETCEWYDPKHRKLIRGTGFCRSEPPKFDVDLGDQEALWPITEGATDWCAHHSLRPAPSTSWESQELGQKSEAERQAEDRRADGLFVRSDETLSDGAPISTGEGEG